MLEGEIALTAVRPTPPVPGAATGTVVSLKAEVNGAYVTAEDSGAAPLVANRSAIGPWEQFDLVDAGGDTIALRAHANGRFVTAGSAPLIADGTEAGRAQSFRLVRDTDGTVSLLAVAGGRYVTAADAGASALIADRTAIGPWKRFTLTTGP